MIISTSVRSTALEPQAMDLEAARASYEERGYWLSPVLFDEVEVARFCAATGRVLDGEYRGARAPTLCLPPNPTDHDLRKIDNAWWADPDLAALATDPRLATIAAAL